MLPPIQLAPATQQLRGVEVVGQKPLLELQAGKMVLNVADSPAAAGATALEVLQKVPGLVVLNDRLSLAGREGLTILLDGRPTRYLDVVSVLRDFPSSNIEEQLQLRLALADVLFTNKQRGTVRYQDQDIRFFTQNESRQLRLSLSYKFGNQQLLAARKRATGLDEERGRVKSDKE